MFIKKSKELFENLGEHKIMVLATAENNKVTARSMSVIICNNQFYFQTDKNFLKYQQITNNKQVALCYNNMQIEGIAEELGSPLDKRNIFFAEKFKIFYTGSFEKYSHMKSEIVFRVTPTLITLWQYEGNTPYREYYNFLEQTYLKEYYDNLV